MFPFAPVSRLPTFAILLALAWILAVLQLVVEDWAAIALTFPDADDAMRLVQVRDFLAGKGWFDLHEARLAPPAGYDSHWSRLIDAGLAGLFLLFGTVMKPDLAERLTAVVWPVLWLLPMIGGVAAVAWRLAGRDAALLTLLLALFSLPAFQQFRPGRIDHHNVQMALAVLAVAASVWADRWKPAPWVTGVLSGLALAIGFESVPFVAIAGAGFALRFMLDRDSASSLGFYGLTVAAGAVAAFFVTVGPSRWLLTACDAIAINSTAAVVTGGLALAAASQYVRSDDWRLRTLAMAGSGALALAVFAAIEPRCLGGVFALSDPAIGPVWINHVAEVQSVPAMMHRSLVNGLATIGFPVVALIALLTLAPLYRDPGFAIAAAAFVLACAATFAVSKVFSYAVWFGLPFVAAALMHIRRVVPRTFAALILTPSALGLGAIGIGSAAGSNPIDMNPPGRQACVSRTGTVGLATLPPGLVLTNELVFGPYIMAFTPHSVLAAPYHRLSSVIVTAHAALAKPPAETRRIFTDTGVDYIAVCGQQSPLGVTGDALEKSLWTQLRADLPDWLEPLQLEGAYKVYRVRKDRL